MNCLNPRWTWQGIMENGKHGPVYSRRRAFVDLPKIPMPCRKCGPCKTVRQNMMGVRIIHEASMHERSCIFHATFDNDHIGDGKLKPDHLKRFAEGLKEIVGEKMRMVAVGEYGSTTGRAHYHGAIYGYDLLEGSRIVKRDILSVMPSQADKSKVKRYSNPLVSEAWGNGTIDLGTMGIDGAKYIAKYIVEDVGGTALVRWPRNPPLGYGWIEKYRENLIRTGQIIIDGQPQVIPRQYFEWFDEDLDKVKSDRKAFAKSQAVTPEQQRKTAAARYENQLARMSMKKRKARI